MESPADLAQRPIIKGLWLVLAFTFPLFSVEFLRWNDRQILRISFAVPMIVLLVILAIAAVMAMSEGLVRKSPLISRPLGGPLLYGTLLLFLIWHVISLVRSEDFGWALREVIKLAMGITAFWIVLAFFPREPGFHKRFWKIALWSSAALMAFLIYQYAFVFVRPFLGNNIDEATRAGRNMLTWYLVFILPFAVTRFMDSRRKIIEAVPLMVLTIAWIYAGSRGAWVSVVFGLLVMLALLIRDQPVRGLKISLAMAVGISAAAASSLWVLASCVDSDELEYGKKLVSLFDPDAVPELNSTAERVDLIEQALVDFADHPLAGIGLMNFFGQRELVTHNDYLGILAEMGVIGLCLFLAILSNVFFLLFQGARKSGWLALGTRSSLMGVIFSFFIINAYTNMIFWIFLGLVVVVSETEARIETGADGVCEALVEA
jgi:O-antigen ligase